MSQEPADQMVSAAPSDDSPPTIPPAPADVHPAAADEAAAPAEAPVPDTTDSAPAAAAEPTTPEASTPTLAADEATGPAMPLPPTDQPAVEPVAWALAAPDAAVVEPAAIELAAAEATDQAATTGVRRGSRWRFAAAVLLLFPVAIGLGFGTAFLVHGLADVVMPSQAAIASSTPPSPSPTLAPTTRPSPTASSGPSASPSTTPTPRGSSVIYVVQHGDILSDIAARYGVTVQAIVAANGLKDPNHIEPGQRLVIPLP